MRSILLLYVCRMVTLLLIWSFPLPKVQCQNSTAETNQTKATTTTDFRLPGLNKFDKVRLNEKNYERVRNMHVNWYAAGIKALMGKLGRELYAKLIKDEQRHLANCLDGIEDKKDLVLAANCLINARRAYQRRIILQELVGSEGKNAKKSNFNGNIVEKGNKNEIENVRQKVWNGKMDIKESEKNANVEDGKNEEEKWPKRKLKRINLRKLVRKRAANSEFGRNNKTGPILNWPHRQESKLKSAKLQQREWAKRLRRFRGINGKFDAGNGRTGEEEEKKIKRERSKWAVDREGLRPKFQIRQAENLDKLPSQQDRSAISRVSNLISMMAGKNSTEIATGPWKWTRMYDSLVNLKRANDKRKESPGARVYEMRMYDLVLDRKEPSLGPKEKRSPQGLLQLGLSLLNKLHNESAQRDSNFKLMSPRFAPLMPDKQDATKSILSPTVFALYETEIHENDDGGGGDQLKKKKRRRGGGERGGGGGILRTPDIASIPEVLKATGLNRQDRDALLQSLMEVSGSIGHVQEAMDLLKALNFFEIEPDLMDANERVLNAYTKMERAFDAEQEGEIERQGWTFLRRRQFDQLCQEQHGDFPEEIKNGIEYFGTLDRERREAALWKRIERIARNIPDDIGDKLDKRKHEKLFRLHLESKERRRRKRQAAPPIQWLSVLNPVILQPFMFTPVYGLSVLGPLVLSPNIFSPLILAPSVLSPYILSPAAPIPYILSPYVFGPFILSPMALAPFILTPYVLSPNVLNPFALAPLILSPTVLSPDILSPQVLGGGILSPTVGSPAVLTESYLMASVLSPSVLSK